MEPKYGKVTWWLDTRENPSRGESNWRGQVINFYINNSGTIRFSQRKISPATWSALIWQISGWVKHQFFSYDVSWYKYIYFSAKQVTQVIVAPATSRGLVCSKTHWKLQAKFSINKCILIAARRTSDFVVQNYLGFLFALPQNSTVHEERYLRCLRKLHISVVNFTSTLEALQTLRPSR